MNTVFRLALVMVAASTLSGCITVICPDGKDAVGPNGKTVTVFTPADEAAARKAYCRTDNPQANFQPLTPSRFGLQFYVPAFLAGAGILGLSGSSTSSTTGTTN